MSLLGLTNRRDKFTFLAAFAVFCALALMFGLRVLGWAFLPLGVWTLARAYRLATGAVAPGPRTGFSALGQALSGVGFLAMGTNVLRLFPESTPGSWILGTVMLGGVLGGLLIERRARLQ